MNSPISTAEDTKVRLERARHQYENLLLQVGAATLSDMTASATLKDTPAKSLSELLTTSATPMRLIRQEKMVSGTDPSSFSPQFTMEDKAETIIALQEENDAIKKQLQLIMDSTEQMLLEAQTTHNELVQNYEHRILLLENKNMKVTTENEQLKVSLELAQAQLQVERNNLAQSLSALEKYHRRSRSFIEVQKKAQGILKSVDGMHYLNHSQDILNSKVAGS